jgi:hypothetical protein
VRFSAKTPILVAIVGFHMSPAAWGHAKAPCSHVPSLQTSRVPCPSGTLDPEEMFLFELVEILLERFNQKIKQK